MTAIGKPVYGNSNENKRPNSANANWRLDKEGSHVYRILPPFGLLAKAGRWAQYEALHWGPTLTNGKKRAFRCIQRKNRKTKMIESECPMCIKINGQRTLLEEKIKTLLSQGKSQSDVKEMVKPIEDWLQIFNLQKGHFLNVLRPDGQIGRLFLKIKCKQALDIKLPKFIEKCGVDPIDVEGGLWLDFQRTGMGRNDTVYDVGLVEELVEINGRKLTDVKKAPLTTEVINRMAKEAFELATYYKDLTYDEVQMMVSSGFDPEIVDSVFGAPVVSASPEVEGKNEFEEELEPEHSDFTPDFTPLPVSMTESNLKLESDSTVSDEESVILAQLAALRAKKSPSKPSAVSNTKELSTEDFIKAFNTGKL